MNPWVLSCLSHFCRQIWSFPRPKHQDLFKFWLDFKMETYLPGRLLGGCLEPGRFPRSPQVHLEIRTKDVEPRLSPQINHEWFDEMCIFWYKKTIYDICNIFFMYVKTRYLQISLSPTIGTVPQLFDSCQVRHIHHGLTSFASNPDNLNGLSLSREMRTLDYL